MTLEKIGAYEVHPINTACVPRANDRDRARLRESIGADGFDPDHPILRFRGQIIVGRERLDQCYETNTRPIIRDWVPPRNCKTEAEIQLALLKKIRREDFDRRMLEPHEIADGLTKLFPPKPRGRPKSAENAADGNVSPETLSQPSDGELASAAGISPATLSRARSRDRETEEMEEAVREKCIPAIRKKVGKTIPLKDAFNISDLTPKQQRECLAEISRKGTSRSTLLSARAHLFSNRDGLSAKTEAYHFNIDVTVLGEGGLPAARLLLQRNPDQYNPKDGKTHKTRIRSGGRTGRQSPTTHCANCDGVMFESDADWHERKISSAGVSHRECPQ